MSPGFHLDTAFAKGLRELFVQVEDRLALKRPVTAYLAGGMAVHLYTGKRVTKDADVEFSARVLVPNDLAVRVQDDDGVVKLLHVDTNYNPMFSLLHQDYQQDALEVDLGLIHLRLFVLRPVDLAVSKIARFAPIDREDIQDLVAAGLVTSSEIDVRGREALEGYIGNVSAVSLNLRDAVAMARNIEQAAGASS